MFRFFVVKFLILIFNIFLQTQKKLFYQHGTNCFFSTAEFTATRTELEESVSPLQLYLLTSALI